MGEMDCWSSNETTNAVIVSCDYNGCVISSCAASRLHRAVYGFLLVNSVANGEAVTTLGAAASQNLAAVLSLHASTETVLVSLLDVRWLKCTFHYYKYIYVFVNCDKNFRLWKPTFEKRVQNYKLY